MAELILSWSVDDPGALVAAGLTHFSVEKDDGGWSEITRANNRITIAEAVETYLWQKAYDDGSYRVVPVNADGDSGDPITVTASISGYCTVQEIRDEGYAEAAHSDERVQSAIDRATKKIDKICGQSFGPRYSKIALNVDINHAQAHLDQVLIALIKCTDNDTEIERSDVAVYNRHLTQGLGGPDDRGNPMLEYKRGRWIDGISTTTLRGNFERGTHTLVIEGIWGYTELDEEAGETSLGSGVPLNYGSVPDEIKAACMMLTTSFLPTLAMGGDTSDKKSRIISEKTRDQSYTLAARPEADDSYGMTGSVKVDAILQEYRAPMKIGAV